MNASASGLERQPNSSTQAANQETLLIERRFDPSGAALGETRIRLGRDEA